LKLPAAVWKVFAAAVVAGLVALSVLDKALVFALGWALLGAAVAAALVLAGWLRKYLNGHEKEKEGASDTA